MKKLLRIMAAIAVSIACVIPASDVFAENDYSDTAYWSDYCSQSSNQGSTACKAYVAYLTAQSKQAAEDLEAIEAQRDQIAANLELYDQQLKDLQNKIDSKQAEIDAKQAEIDAKQAEIDNKQAEIDETQAQVDSLQEKIKNRMVSQQSTMRLSQYTDILMGASTFEDFIRILNGLDAINQSDKSAREELVRLINLLNSEKIELENAKQELENQKQELTDAQNELIILREQTEVIIEEQEKQAAMLEAQGNRIAANIASIQETLKKVDLDGVAAAAGWTFPVPGSHRSAGTWAYPGGSVHLGYDFAATVGTEIRAAANGVVIHNANGCPTYGSLGSKCGSQYGGSTGGGNQVYLLVKVNGNLYAMKYLHMMINTPIAVGTTVYGGDVIGRVGSSGNSSGPHCHIEIFYLGDASNFSYYAKNWNGDLAFGAGWAGSDRKCESGYGAPCRIRPESVFGG